MGAVAGSSSTVSQGTRAVGCCSYVGDPVGGLLAGLGTLVPGVRSRVAGVGCFIVSCSSLVPILGAPVPVVSYPTQRFGVVLLNPGRSSIILHSFCSRQSQKQVEKLI